MVKNLDCLEQNLKEEIKKRAEALNVSDEKIERLLNKEYSFLVSGIWRTKIKKTKEGLGLQGRRNKKMEYIKLTTKNNLFQYINELVALYKAYKSIDTIKDALAVIKQFNCN